MSSAIFRRRELQPHQSVNAANDRSSYAVRRVTELDVLSAIGSIVNASGGRGVARFVQCEATRLTWLRTIERALLERHLSRLLHFSPSLEEASKHFCSDALYNGIREGLDDYGALVRYTVFALMSKDVDDHEGLREAAIRPERLVKLLYCARQRAMPILVSWLLGENHELVLGYDTAHNILNALQLSVQQELEAVRVFITDFLGRLGEQVDGVPMATHVPETFICDGGQSGGQLSLENELDELRSSYKMLNCSEKSPKAVVLMNILDPSLQCRAYCDEKDGLIKYQWLPTDFQVGIYGAVTVLSPLHGSVHPNQFPGLYAAIPQFLGRMLPLFEHALGTIARQDPPLPHNVGLTSSRLTRCEQPDDSEEVTQLHTAQSFDLRDRQLQVVVKLSTIQLDEAHPAFTGDQDNANFNRSWQLDGDNHEHVVAMGYHVIRSRNITQPRLAFRAFSHCPDTTAESELTSQEDEFLAFGERTSAFYRGRYGRQFLQPWGSLALHETRSIVVPSFLTHRMEPFELLDATNPEGGEFTVATFYLVDPTIKPIVSTSNVHPEQWQQTRHFVRANVDMVCCSRALPEEVALQIADFAACHALESQARLTRQQLLIQRQKLQELRFMTPSLRLEEMVLDLDNEN